MGKIATQEFEYDEVIDGIVTPFGTSAHIPFKKRFVGLSVKVLIPKKKRLFWLLDAKDKKEVIEILKDLKNTISGYYKEPRKETMDEIIKEISGKKFSLETLEYVLSVLDHSSPLFKRIVKKYNLEEEIV